MAEPSFVDPSPFANFPQFDASDLSFDDPNLFPDGGFPLPEGIAADFDLDDIDLDFSVDDLFLPSADDNNNGSSSNSNSNITANFNSNSGSNPGSPESGNSSGASGVVAQEEKNNSRLKRKIDDNGIIENPNPSPNSNPSSRNHKIQRSDEGRSLSSVSAGTEEDEKHRARLMRNRESAHLSRQRKKQYVEELEEKVKVMNSTIADLNGKISFYMAENARLHQQLSGNGANGSDGKGNPPPHYYFPWIPYGGYPMRHHNGPPVPYVPIPRLKPQQPVSAPKVKKTEGKKSESKTKKVASVSLLGLFFVMMVFGGVRNFGLGGNKDKVYGGFGGSHGRVLTVKDRGNSLNNTQEFRQFSGKMGCSGRGNQNSTESLPALLYVPRNGKHVEINGNLIIHSVLASERAMAQSKSRGQEKQLSANEGTGLMIPGHVASALAIPEGAMGVGTDSRAYRNSAEYPRALGSGSHDAYSDNIKSTLADGPFQQWFREGLAGPILSSGTCTEVFQFEVSPSSINPSSIIPATSVVNSTDELPPVKIKNRRIMYSQPIPLNGSALNTTESNNTVHGSKNTIPSSSMVVSVLADPREAGDGDGDEMIRPKSITRIFVVVLLDSVKYVTYSCMLPLKNHGPHLVN